MVDPGAHPESGTVRSIILINSNISRYSTPAGAWSRGGGSSFSLLSADCNNTVGAKGTSGWGHSFLEVNAWNELRWVE